MPNPAPPPAPSPSPAPAASPARLMSLDALRGFDMFWILGADELVNALGKFGDSGPLRFLADQMEHRSWGGFAFYDLIFPLFVFMVGISLVFSLDRLVQREGRAAALKRVVRRGLLLYLLGIFYYGGFATPFAQIRLLGVLQRLALCYLFAGLIYCLLELRGRVAICVGLLIGYWALMTFVPAGPYGAGNFAEGKNLANWIDAQYLPLRKWDITHDPEGLLSTLPAISTCLLGVFAGMLLKTQALAEQRKVLWLLAGGVGLAGLGWLWDLQFPVIKKIWTSSYVLVAGGYSCLFLAAFHWIIEVRQWRRWALPFVWIGMNPITLYMLHNLVDFGKIARRFVGGDVNRWFGSSGQLMVLLAMVGLTFWVSHFLYRRKIFLRF